MRPEYMAGAVHVFADEAQRFRRGEGDVARDLRLRNFSGAKAEGSGVGVAGLLLKHLPFDGAAVEARRRAGLEAAGAQAVCISASNSSPVPSMNVTSLKSTTARASARVPGHDASTTAIRQPMDPRDDRKESSAAPRLYRLKKLEAFVIHSPRLEIWHADAQRLGSGFSAI